jgi:hypothetical protein
MAVGITNAYKNQARRGTVRLQDADTTLTTHNGTSVGGIPIPTTGKGLLAVNVTAFAGGTNVTVKLQHSVDGNTWSDVSGATTSALTATGAVAVAFNGFVGPYVRAVSTVTGTFTSLTVTTDIYVTD